MSRSVPSLTTLTKDATLSGADIVWRVLCEQGVEVIFGYPGGAVLPLYDTLFQKDDMPLRHILVRHEQAAAHAAEGYARSTGKVGMLLVTSGPGVTNTITGLTDAFMDSIPIICLSGQVATHLIGSDAFQEADTVGITRPCTKHNYLVKDVRLLASTIREAFHVATSGRPGPVIIDIPKDVQIATTLYTPPSSKKKHRYAPKTQPSLSRIDEAVSLMAQAQRPIFYVGGGVINAGAHASTMLCQLVQETGFPITQTLMALGAYPTDAPQSLGMLGMHGTYEANLAMHGCDVMIAIGARFDDRITGCIADFSPDSQKIHIDIDPSSINKNILVDIPIIADAGHAIEAMLRAWRQQRKRQKTTPSLAPWWRRIEGWRAKKCLHYEKSATHIKPQYALERLNHLLSDRDDVYITTEVGQHQMWAAQFMTFRKPHHWMTSGGLGTMGYGFPSAIGVQLAHPKACVIDIAGEASILMNIQELSTAMQYKLPVKIFILNNQYMGMVRQWQELLYGNRLSQSYTASLPDFVQLAQAFGACGLRASKPDDVDDVIHTMLSTDNLVIADIRVDPQENCFPMIPAGAAHNNILLKEGDTPTQTSAEGMVQV
ncbi:MAG: acetolactate synthase 3 large subunit [Alphaproteobacteria bacterium GM7ARS4]|nr:acetolactate synthase 3 large subunit [Alphaproteobacteria bacterium GM7ARS4]